MSWCVVACGAQLFDGQVLVQLSMPYQAKEHEVVKVRSGWNVCASSLISSLQLLAILMIQYVTILSQLAKLKVAALDCSCPSCQPSDVLQITVNAACHSATAASCGSQQLELKSLHNCFQHSPTACSPCPCRPHCTFCALSLNSLWATGRSLGHGMLSQHWP